MKLYLLRHGIAEDREAGSGARDSERSLTAKGAQRVRQIAQAMEEQELTFDLVLSSPIRRARQTAELVAEGLRIEDRLQFSTHLGIPPATARLLEQINATRPLPESVLLVGHEPHLSELTSLLVAGSPALDLTFKKGGLCLLEVSGLQAARCATLEWLATPKQMLLMT